MMPARAIDTDYQLQLHNIAIHLSRLLWFGGRFRISLRPGDGSVRKIEF